MAEISRKEFLKGVGKAVAGVTVVGTLGSVLTGCTTAEPTSAVAEKPQWPFPYKKLDPEKVLARGFKGYKEKGG
ncbi:MAG: split soret cytochrome c precursor [Clostridia bacterium]|jgi:hypothetical protein|nr:split soret cytochrome c precursor [Clostridia bacterium]MDF2890781.1 split soret cytochrome c precursor [Clostridia bacterium]